MIYDAIKDLLNGEMILEKFKGDNTEDIDTLKHILGKLDKLEERISNSSIVTRRIVSGLGSSSPSIMTYFNVENEREETRKKLEKIRQNLNCAGVKRISNGFGGLKCYVDRNLEKEVIMNIKNEIQRLADENNVQIRKMIFENIESD